jgi:hypothetical protein
MWEPWAWCIFRAGKLVENRPWKLPLGAIVIQAAKRYDESGARYLRQVMGIAVPEARELVMGALVGVVRVVGHTRESGSPWAQPDCWHNLLADPQEFPRRIPWRGRQGVFWVPICETCGAVPETMLLTMPEAERAGWVYAARQWRCQACGAV